MKRFLSAVGILVFLLAACTASALVVNSYCIKTISHLEKAKESAESKNYSAAYIHSKKAAEQWQSKAGLLGTLLRHSEADQVETGLAKLSSYAQTRDHDEFLALCAEVICSIRHVRDMELPLLRNIL